nr:L2 protein [Equus caballus papillomavirus 7]
MLQRRLARPPPRKRRPRAAVEDIYRGCKPFGTCPDDVVNRVEQKTWADRLLQWFSSVIYFGGLSIGSGRGSGGATGYRPIGTPALGEVAVGSGSRTVRVPPVLVDSVAPVDTEVFELIPLQPLEPGGPSVVSGSDPGVLVTNGAALPPELPGVIDGVGPEDVIPGRDPAILQVGQGDVGDSHFVTPTVERPGFAGSSRDSFYVVGAGSRGDVVGEEIELYELPRTSTPDGAGDIFERGLGNRRYEQVYVENPVFLQNPRELVAFGDTWGETPDSLSFDPVVASPLAAPNELFTDVVHLGRQVFEEGPQGVLRVGRVGRRGTIQTRRGTQIGGRVHFYHDLSPILPAEEIELSDLTSPPGFESTNSSETAFTEVDLRSEPSTYSDTYLLEEDTLSIDGHLVFADGPNDLVDLPHTVSVPARGGVGAGSVSVLNWSSDITSTSLAPALHPPLHPEFPEIVIDGYGLSALTFVLHRRRRKRGSHLYFSDVLLAV